MILNMIRGNTPTGTKNITENGTYDVTEFASASVAVPEPSGTKTITTNGTHDVAAYASATVNVPTENPPSGTVNITANGTVDVTNYASASVNVPTGTARTGSDLSASGKTVTVPAGLYSQQYTKDVSSVQQATPSISVNTSTGAVSASATQSAGYVAAGTKTASYSLSTQGAQTIHPSLSQQTISSGKYLTGTQTIKGVQTTNLVPGYIKNGVTIKIGDSSDDDCVTAVTGTYIGSGGTAGASTQGVRVQRTSAYHLEFSGLSVPSGATLGGVILSKTVASGYDDGDGTIITLVAIGQNANTVAFLATSMTAQQHLLIPNLTNAVTLTINQNGTSGSIGLDTSKVLDFGAGDYMVYPIYTA